jgi:hypothetical protein
MPLDALTGGREAPRTTGESEKKAVQRRVEARRDSLKFRLLGTVFAEYRIEGKGGTER